MQFDGWAASLGQDPLYELPLDRYLNLIYHWLTREGEPEQIERFDLKLWLPPPGWGQEDDQDIPEESPWSADSERSAFASFSTQVQGRPKPPEPADGRPGPENSTTQPSG